MWVSVYACPGICVRRPPGERVPGPVFWDMLTYLDLRVGKRPLSRSCHRIRVGALLAIAQSIEELLAWEAVELVRRRPSEAAHLATYPGS